MKKYKINNESNLPSDEAINKQKQDFGMLFHEYEKVTKRPKKPIYKDPKYFFLLLVLALVAYLIYEVTTEDEKEENKTQQQDNNNNS